MKNNKLSIDRIAFIGRTFAEYMKMFDLDEDMLRQGPVLDCPAGPSSFAAEANNRGINITACDICYDLEVNDLSQRGKDDIAHVFDKFDEASHLYIWNHYKNKDEVIAHRSKSLELFIGDFSQGLKEGRYRKIEFPGLPFSDRTFSLVLSGHFLFLYGDRMDFDFHVSCLKELMRVCSGEVRIFPLVGLDAKPYDYLNDILSILKFNDISVEITKVPFEFQKGSNQMMKLYHNDGG